MTARPVLAATDGSPTSLAAVHWAAEEAARRGTSLRLVHVWPQTVGIYLDQLQREGARLLTRVRDEVAGRHPGLDVDTALIGAAAVDGLVQAAADGELLVLGSRGMGGFKGLLVGSVSLAVAARSPIPVVVVRPGSDATAPDADRTGDVVVGVGPGENAAEVLEFAFASAEERDSRLLAVHGWNLPVMWAMPGTVTPPIDSAVLESAARKHLVETLRPWQDKYPQIEVVLRTDAAGPAKAVTDASKGAGLVVIGRHMPEQGTGRHLGFTAHAALHHADAPVAVVPHH